MQQEQKKTKNASHMKGWNSGMTQSHVEPLPINLIKGTYDGKSDKDIVKLKLRRDPTSSKLDLYEFSMSLFDNGDPEEFFCSCVTSTCLSRRHVSWRRARIFNNFVR